MKRKCECEKEGMRRVRRTELVAADWNDVRLLSGQAEREGFEADRTAVLVLVLGDGGAHAGREGGGGDVGIGVGGCDS